jgi:hypothetical protein
MTFLPLGLRPITDWLNNFDALDEVPTADECERFYDRAREMAMFVLRCDRTSEDLRLHKQAFRRVSACVKGCNASACQIKFSTRLDALADLLADQELWNEHYRLGNARTITGFDQVMKYLHDMTFLENQPQLEMGSHGLKTFEQWLWLPAQLKLIDWEEKSNGKTAVWLTSEGERMAKSIVGV